MQYRREIDGLRAVAVLPVIFFHAMPDVARGGFLGVDVFFVISGYLITTIIMTEVERGRFSILGFYERRARRILPALFVVMAASIPFAWMWMLPNQLEEFARSLIAVPLFGSNFLFWSQSGYFAQAGELKPLLHTWSLAVEEQFYVVFPLFLALVWRFGRRNVVALIVLGLLASLAVAQWGASRYPDANFFLAPGRAWELLAGSLCAFWLERRQSRPHSNLLSGLGLVMVFASIALFDKTLPSPGLITLAPVGGVVLFILFASPQTWAGRLLSGRLVVGVGLISYSAYLWHQPIFAFARIRSMQPPGVLTYAALTLLSLALAFATWKLVEQPARQKVAGRMRLQRRRLFAGAAVLSLAFISVGLGLDRGLLQPPGRDQMAGMQRQIDDIRDARLAFVSRSDCEVWPISAWPQQWKDCDPYQRGDRSDLGDRVAVPIAVVGDSHASDLAAGLRLNGYEPFQATGLGCSLRPQSMGRNCRAYFDFVKKQLMAQGNLREIWLANRFNRSEFSAAQLRDALEYWSQTGLKLVLFTPMPEYPFRNDLLLKSALFDTAIDQQPDRSLSDMAGNGHVARLQQDFAVTIVDSDRVFCALSGNCAFQLPDGDFLTSDNSHLSALGARRFVRAVLDQTLCEKGNRAAPCDRSTPKFR